MECTHACLIAFWNRLKQSLYAYSWDFLNVSSQQNEKNVINVARHVFTFARIKDIKINMGY